MTCTKNSLTHSFFIKFHTELQSYFQSTNVALIIGRMEFWFENKKYKDGFYKFVEPCRHPLYREGDSWSEELGLSRKLFGKAFDIIGIRYKSKSAYLNAKDTFQGKLYASYHDRKTNRTYFIRNHDFVSQLLGNLLTKKTLPKSEKKEKVPKESPVYTPAGRSCNGDLGRSFNNIQKKTSSSLSHTDYKIIKNPPKTNPPEPDFTEEIIKIWNEEIGELGVCTITKGLSTRLNKILKTCFNNSLTVWHEYCQLISSSKFLMGESQNKFFKKAWITWAIKPETIENIKRGAYKLGDRQTKKEKETNTISHEIKILEIKRKNIEESINNFKKSTREERKKIIKEKRKSISDNEHEILKKEFIQILESESSPITDEFKRAGWNGLFVECSYWSFLEEKIAVQLFETSDEVNENQAIQRSGLLELLKRADDELNDLKQKKKKDEIKFDDLEYIFSLKSYTEKTYC